VELNDYLNLMVSRDASDLYLAVGAPASMRVNGQISPVEKAPLTPVWMRETAFKIMNPDQQKSFLKNPEMNVALGDDEIGRFRVNIFKQRGHVGMVIRCIKTEIPDAELLGIPSIVKKLIMQKRGLILFVGATGSGKSTSLASLIDYRNTNSAGHIITIEDPIEYVHRHKRSIINQREVGDDTMTYADALKNTLRQAPDVILIGEIRDRETMEHAIAFAETGHLAISTLHANNSNQAVERIVNFFPEERHNQLYMDLSLNLKGVVSQRLIPSLDGKRVAAFEILLGTPLVSDLLLKGDIHKIKEVMERSENLGMKTFDSALYSLYKSGHISFEEALRNADSQNNLRLRISLEERSDQDQSGLRLSEEEAPHGTLNGMFSR